MHKIFVLVFLTVFTGKAFAQKPYITVWDTRIVSEASGNNQILFPGKGTNYKIDWEEKSNPANKGTFEITKENQILSFSKPGIYILKTSSLNNSTFSQDFLTEYIEGTQKLKPCDNNKLIEVSQWGDVVWSTMKEAFQRCENLEITAQDIPNLSKVTTMYSMFDGCKKMVDNSSMNLWDVSNVERMEFLFNECIKFNQPLNNWNVSKVQSFFFMFSNAKSFNQPLDNWTVNNSSDFTGMFERAEAFNQPLNKWQIKSDAWIYEMFKDAKSFNQPLNNWNVSKVTSFKRIFYGATAFNQDLSSWKTEVSNIENEGMFEGATSFSYDKKVPKPLLANDLELYRGILEQNSLLSNKRPFITVWNTDNPNTTTTQRDEIKFPMVGDIEKVEWIEENNQNNRGVAKVDKKTRLIKFKQPGTYIILVYPKENGTLNINFPDSIKLLKIVSWGDSKWGQFTYGFYNCRNLDVIATDIPNLSNTKAMDYMFLGCTSLKANNSIGKWRVDGVEKLKGMFKGCNQFNQPLNEWYISSDVTDLEEMFNGCTAFNQPLNKWRLQNVRNMNAMFANCTNFNQSINDWSLGRDITSVSHMFENCVNFNQPFDKWASEAALNIEDASYMFKGCSKFNQSLNTWHTYDLKNADGMFEDCIAYNQPMNEWANYVNKLETSKFMFKGAKSFNQDIGYWTFKEIKYDFLSKREGMFEDAISFSQFLPWLAPDLKVEMTIFKGATTYINNFKNIINKHFFKKDVITEKDYNAKAFITKWKTDITIIRLPVKAQLLRVKWQDATNPAIKGDTTFYNLKKEDYNKYINILSLPNKGIYNVSIQVPNTIGATIEGSNDDNYSLVDITQWGDIVWEKLYYAFSNCKALNVTATDAPNLTKATDLSYMFQNCSALIGNPSFNKWNTIDVVKTNSMFKNCTLFNQPLGDWNVYSLEELIGMFENASSFNQDLSKWKLSNVKECYYVFLNATAYKGIGFKRYSQKEQNIRDLEERKIAENKKNYESSKECRLYLDRSIKDIKAKYESWKQATENEFKYSIKDGSVSRTTSELIRLFEAMKETAGLGVCNGLGREEQDKLTALLQEKINGFKTFEKEYANSNKKPSIWEILVTGLQITTGTY